MSNYQEGRGNTGVILAWIVLALQIIGLLWLLLFGHDQLAALSGDGSGTAVAVAGATTAVEPLSTAETIASPTPATEPPATDSAATEATADTETAPATPTAQAAETNAESVTLIAPEEVAVDPSTVAPDWLAALVQGAPPDEAAGRPGLPPHLLLTFVDPDNPDAQPAAPDSIDLNRPQLRIIPIAALLAMLDQQGDAAGRQALEDLLSLLQQQPEAGQAIIPAPPILGKVDQNFVARVDYEPFGGGSGVGYVTNITGEAIDPVTNESGLNYIFQGLTADGEQYVFMSWPVDAAFLPQTAADVPDDVANALQTDRAAYFDVLRGQIETADDTDLSPSPSLLTLMLSSLAVRGQTVATDESAVVPATAADAIGVEWHWTGRVNSNGEEDPVENPQNYVLVFWPDGTYNIKADCNIGSGTYTYDEKGGVQLNSGPLSRAFCPAGSRDTEFAQSLLAARSVGFNESGDLVLALQDGSSMILTNAGPVELQEIAPTEDRPAAADAGLTGITLQWPGFTDNAGQVIAVDNPEDYLLTLLPDGTFNIVADCNVGGGVYIYGDDGSLHLGPIRTTLAMCPEGSQGAAFVNFLEGVTSVAVSDNGSVTMTTADSSSAMFISGGPVSGPEANTQTAPAGDPLNTIWQWTGYKPLDGAPVAVGNPELYNLALLDDGTYIFRADCNNGTGQYTLEGATLTPAPAAVTLVACGDDSLSEPFAGYLGRVVAYGFDAGGNLSLTLDDGGSLLFANGGPFSAADTGGLTTGATDATNPLVGTIWQWTHFRDAKQDYDVTGAYKITFNADGTATVVADCNTGNGSYSFNGDDLTLSIGVVTRAACPPGSLGDSFIEYLNQAGTFAAGNGVLTIELMADGGAMTFAATQ